MPAPHIGAARADRRGTEVCLTAGFALLHEAALGCACELLAVGADRLGLAGIVAALLHERGFCGARERLAILADRLGIAGRILRECGAGGKGGENGNQENLLHDAISLGAWTMRAIGTWNRDTIKFPG